MQISIVIPVWNGASVIADCLNALYAHCGNQLLEVVCVDNASHDESASIIARRFPQARLILLPVNLGFAGGVNAGMRAAQGDVFILLNQDCIIQPGWLEAMSSGLTTHPDFGIAGCTIVNGDGSINHAGAMIRHPDAAGIHLTDIGDGLPRCVEYVTGAAFAIRRQVWETVGDLDEGFYPAYYEECDYCYRARRRGFKVGYLPEAQVTHLFSSQEWQADPIKHAARQCFARYRFVCKHWSQVSEFFDAEIAAVNGAHFLNEAMGRAIAARHLLQRLPDILERRRLDLGEQVASVLRRQLQVGFAQVLRQSLQVAERLTCAGPDAADEMPLTAQELESATQRLLSLQQREYDLIARIYFKRPEQDRPEPFGRRLFRLLVLRPLSLVTGREHLLLAELDTVHTARMDQINIVDELRDRARLQLDRKLHKLNEQLKLLKMLTDYEYF